MFINKMEAVLANIMESYSVMVVAGGEALEWAAAPPSGGCGGRTLPTGRRRPRRGPRPSGPPGVGKGVLGSAAKAAGPASFLMKNFSVLHSV